MDHVAHFRILGKIGAGGMGEVYRALDEDLRREVAIKIMSPARFDDDTARATLLREARSAAGLNHPNICVIHEVGESDGRAWIAMECVEGEPLDARIRRTPLLPGDAIRFGIQLADALAHAHARGIVHRDLKPQNIIVTPEQRLKVLDFGLARTFLPSSASESTTDVLATSVIAGTPAYMAPEALRGSAAGPGSDIWAAGVILYEMVGRCRPFDGNTWPELSAAILAFDPKPLPGNVPIELESIIRRCLQKEPHSRYSTAAELRSALEAVQSAPAIPRPVPSTIGRRAWIAAAALVAALIGAYGLMTLDRSSRLSTPSPTGRASAIAPPADAAFAGPSVAVLPFAALSGPEQEYLSDGIQDAVIGELARMKELRVISRTSTLAFKRASTGAVEIGRSLNADNLVEGSVSSTGQRIRIRVTLIRVRPQERQLWSESYESRIGDALSLYGEIGSAIATHIDASLAATSTVSRRPPGRELNPKIYTLYLRGMYQLHRGGEEGFKAGIAAMNEAIALDPADPLPYAGLAQAYELRIHDGLATPEDIDLAKAAANKASSTAVGLPEVYGANAMIAQYSDWNWPAARENFERALALNSSLAEIRRHYAWYLIAHNRPEEALAEMRRGRDTEPLNAAFYGDLAWMTTSVGRAADGLSDARKAVALAPDNPYVLASAGFALEENGRFDEALRLYSRARRYDPGIDWLIAHALIDSGQREKAEPIVEKLRRAGTGDAAYGLAHIYCALGNRDEAVRWARAAKEKRAIFAPWMGVDAGLASIRDEPRFRETMASIGIPM